MKFIQVAIIASLLGGCSTPFVEYSNNNSVVVVEASPVKRRPQVIDVNEGKEKTEDNEVKTYPVPLY
jgi:hypothetical protein